LTGSGITWRVYGAKNGAPVDFKQLSEELHHVLREIEEYSQDTSSLGSSKFESRDTNAFCKSLKMS